MAAFSENSRVCEAAIYLFLYTYKFEPIFLAMAMTFLKLSNRENELSVSMAQLRT